MAETDRRGFFARKSKPRPAPIRVLTASAYRLKMTDQADSRKQRAIRQGWQSEAWGYRDSVGELRYAVNFLANCASRMRIFPAAYETDGEMDDPVALSKIAGVPPGVTAACKQAMLDLGNGKLAIANLLHSLSTSITIAGECYLVGQQDPATGVETWTIRSVDEIIITDTAYQLREAPSDPNGSVPWEELDPDYTVVSRVWTPHPRFQLLADSPLRAILDDCESLMIMRRMIRATGRSRLAGAGMLLIPDELSIKVPENDNDDPEADPFTAAIARAMMEPINDEGVASAVVPILVRGPGDTLAQVKHLSFASQFGKEDQSIREELVGVIATGLDIPKEVVTGVSDLNHWTAWQVDDNTFRHHVEPHVIGCCDSLTAAYMRPYLEAMGVDPEWAERVVMWYDPVELVTHPDQSEDARLLHDRFAISDEALRAASGFEDSDAPDDAERQLRLLQGFKAWPPNLVMELMHQWDATLKVPAIETAGVTPGIDATGVILTNPAADATPGVPVTPAAPPVPAPGAAPVPAAPKSPPEGPPPVRSTPTPPVTAAGGRVAHVDLSRKLVDIDRELRIRLQTAACSAMLRHLERAGNKLRTKVARDETLRTKINHKPNSMAAAIIGEDALIAAGISTQDLMGGDWSSLKTQFYSWVEKAQLQSIDVACQIGGLDKEGQQATAARAAMAANRNAAWSTLEAALVDIGHKALYNPDPNGTVDEFGDLNPDTLVPTGTIRVALAIAGGTLPDGS